MGMWRLAGAWRLARSGGARPAIAVLAALLTVAVLAVACGGEQEPAQEFFSQSDDVIEELVPEARDFSMRVFSVGEESGKQVDLTASTLLEGEPRIHVVSDVDAVAGADLVEEYEGFSVYRQKDTFWAELVTEPPVLYAGTPSDEGLKTYVDFYRSGEPKLSDEQFWNAFAYAQERISEVLQEAPSLLVTDFDGEWQAEAGGIRVEATLGERKLYVGVLYAREDVQMDGQAFDGELVDAFEQRFAVPAEAEEQPENADWGYANRIWYADTGAGTGEE